MALFCCPAHFSPQLCCFLKSSQICRGQHFVPYKKMFVCFLFLQQNRIFLWCQRLICIFWCVEFVGCFGQQQSYVTEHLLFYHWNIKYLAFQGNNSCFICLRYHPCGCLLLAWLLTCACFIDWVPSCYLNCFNILGLTFLVLTCLYSSVFVYTIDSSHFQLP